ncbi:MAG: large-conductance mechanosensitive channel protein MscL [Candidatus Azobacteroides sp.]|nr:large-conductance mechanosensitive channel protein MscL [Candidatus Azobacteroides sp.]
MKQFFEEFKKFINRGNVMDMAVGVIIGGAFGKIVSSVVADVIMPPIGLLIGGVSFVDLKLVLKHAAVDAAGNAIPAVTLNYGNFLQNVFDFLIVAFSVFLLVKFVNRLTDKKEAAKAEEKAPALTKEETLLTEIRDLLKKNR